MEMLFSFSFIKLTGTILLDFIIFLLKIKNFFFASFSVKLSICFTRSSASGDFSLILNFLIYL